MKKSEDMRNYYMDMDVNVKLEGKHEENREIRWWNEKI